MTDQKNNAGKPGFRSNTTAFTDPAKIRRQAEQKAKTINIPDPESMTNEEIRQLLYEMQVKQLETEMHVEQLTGGLKKYWDQLELLTTITENMQDMVILTEPGGNITFAGKSLEILGYSPDLLVGKNVMDFVHPEDINRAIEAYNEFVAGNDPPRIQFRCRCKDGSYMWTETRGTVLTDENGNPDKIVLSSRDITERKRTEDALREQTELFQKISDNMFDLISIADIEGNYKYIGSSRNLLGYDPETLVGKNFMEFIHPEDADEITSVFDEALKRGEKVRKVEYRYKTAGGSYSWLETIGKIIMGESGSPEELIFSTRDITDRKQAEEALRETELRFRTVLENLPGGIFAHDLNGRIFMVNHQACKNTGYSREELLQMSVGEIDPHAASREDQTNLWHKLEPGQAATIESIHTRKDGTQYPVEIHLNGIILDGRPAILPVAFDISERKKAEKDLAEQHSLIKAIYRNAPLIMMVVDCDRRLRQVNGFATQFAGRSEQEMLGLRGGEALRCLHALDDPQGCGFGEVCRDCVIRNKVLETLEKGVPNLQAEASFDFSSKNSTQTLTFLVSTTPITF
ncbi:MAG: PAS domain-containing protein, partial [Thermodesulfobacteriota bacterium]